MSDEAKKYTTFFVKQGDKSMETVVAPNRQGLAKEEVRIFDTGETGKPCSQHLYVLEDPATGTWKKIT